MRDERGWSSQFRVPLHHCSTVKSSDGKKNKKKSNETLGALEEDEHFSWKSGRLPEVLGVEEEKRGGGEKKAPVGHKKCRTK